jgi:hypothetical protein
MATFYLLPPRPCLERAIGELFSRLLPGLPLPVDSWDAVTQQIASLAGWPADVYLVTSDELPEGDAAQSLASGYGAEPGDRVVEVKLTRAVRTWDMPTGVSPTAAAR